MIYGEMEFLGIADIPRINTMFYIDNTQWENWQLNLREENIEILTDCKVISVRLEDILLVDRPLPQAIIYKLQNSSKHGAVMVIDYKKEATIGIGEVVSSMIIAGRKSELSNLKYMLMSLLGIKVDPLLGNMTPEDIRLLFLLASGINNMDMLIPIFDGNEERVNRSFSSLKKKMLVDEYAALTQLGSDLVDRVRGLEKKKLGSDLKEDFDNLSKVWDYLDNNSTGTGEALRIICKCGSSKLYGNLVLANLKRFVRADTVKQLKIEIPENTNIMDLIIDTKADSNFVLRSHDYSIIVALNDILNTNEDVQIRILFCLYLSYMESDIPDILHITNASMDKHCRALADNNLIEWENKKLTNAGLNVIHKRIINNVSVRIEWADFDYKEANFRRIEELKKMSAKKKVLDVLQSKYDLREKMMNEPRIQE